MDAGTMISTCFRHQHPECFGRPEVMPEFPVFSATGSEPVPEGANLDTVYDPPPPTA